MKKEKKIETRGRKPKENAARHRLSLRLNDADLSALDALCRDSGSDRATIIRQAIQNAVKPPQSDTAQITPDAK